MKRIRTLCWLAVPALMAVAVEASGPARQTGGIAPAAPAPAEATSLRLSTFAVIHSANVSDYAAYQFKITYMGAQKKITPSLFGVGTGRTFSLAAFKPYQRNYSYANDWAGSTTLTLAPAEFKAFVDGIGAWPSLTDTLQRVDPNLSIMILRDSGSSTRCWEHLCPTRAQSDTLFQALYGAFSDSTRRAIVDSNRHHMVGVRR